MTNNCVKFWNDIKKLRNVHVSFEILSKKSMSIEF